MVSHLTYLWDNYGGLMWHMPLMQKFSGIHFYSKEHSNYH